jgi:hypothetical protein
MVKMTNSLGLFIQTDSSTTIYIEDVQFFRYVESDGKPMLPDEVQKSEIRTLYFYYTPNENYKSIEDVKFIYRGDVPAQGYKEVYNETAYEKIRSITASESNRFNLI